jgi:hypothetical protein
MQIRSKHADLEPLLNSVSTEPLTREEIATRSGLTYNQLRKQLPQLIRRGDITWSSQRNDRGHEIRRYWVPTVAAMLIVLPSIVTFPVEFWRSRSAIDRAA